LTHRSGVGVVSFFAGTEDPPPICPGERQVTSWLWPGVCQFVIIEPI